MKKQLLATALGAMLAAPTQAASGQQEDSLRDLNEKAPGDMPSPKVAEEIAAMRAQLQQAQGAAVHDAGGLRGDALKELGGDIVQAEKPAAGLLRLQGAAEVTPSGETFECNINGMTLVQKEALVSFLDGTVPGTEVVYRDMVAALAKPGADILAVLTPEACHLWHMASCVPSEAGELFDAVKKHIIYGTPLDRANVVEEMGDLEFYLEGMRQGLGITRDECLKQNTEKLLTSEKARYKLGKYSDTQAVARADKGADAPAPVAGADRAVPSSRTFIGSGNEDLAQ